MTAFRSLLTAAIAIVTLTTSTFALADPHGRHWHGDIRHFHDYDYPRWRGGYWHHGDYRGHVGWWWVVGGVWYLYPTPVYPYPDPYIPPAVVDEPAPPRESIWYYCESSRSYYPYASVCPEGWRTVPAQPRDAYER